MSESSPKSSDPSCDNTQTRPADRVAPLRVAFGQLRHLLDQVGDTRYGVKPVTTYGGSIGGHVRHCLDHAHALLQGVNDGLIDYEARQRGTTIETDLRSAIDALDALDLELSKLPLDIGEQTIKTTMLLSPEGPSIRVQSCVDREIAFVFSHTVHHQAMIGGMAKALGCTVPTDFGVAPATICHQLSEAAS